MFPIEGGILYQISSEWKPPRHQHTDPHSMYYVHRFCAQTKHNKAENVVKVNSQRQWQCIEQLCLPYEPNDQFLLQAR